jgi:hypothetical protein
VFGMPMSHQCPCIVICINDLYLEMQEGFGRQIAAKILCVKEDSHSLLSNVFLFGIPVCQTGIIRDGKNNGA